MTELLKRWRWVAAFVVVGACVDPLKFDAGPARDLVIVDGSITTDPGPYTVRLSRAVSLDADTSTLIIVSGATIVLHSDAGESESFTEIKPGEYQTNGLIRGVVGTTYNIGLQMPDGSTFVSEPEKILPSGEVTNISYQFEARTVEKPFGRLRADVFNIFVDAEDARTDQTSYVRWRFKGTYKVATNPERHITSSQGFEYMTPWPCSGYEVDPAVNGGILAQKRECTCCTCYVKEFESSPRMSDKDIVTEGQFRNIKVAEVPVTRASFYEKYRVEVEQMTVTKNAYDFFRVIRAQKDGASNLFQPPPGQLRGNIKAVNANYEVVGLFWGASINRKAIYIREDELPYNMAVDVIVYPCTDVFANSTTTKPDYWDE